MKSIHFDYQLWFTWCGPFPRHPNDWQQSAKWLKRVGLLFFVQQNFQTICSDLNLTLIDICITMNLFWQSRHETIYLNIIFNPKKQPYRPGQMRKENDGRSRVNRSKSGPRFLSVNRTRTSVLIRVFIPRGWLNVEQYMRSLDCIGDCRWLLLSQFWHIVRVPLPE